MAAISQQLTDITVLSIVVRRTPTPTRVNVGAPA